MAINDRVDKKLAEYDTYADNMEKQFGTGSAHALAGRIWASVMHKMEAIYLNLKCDPLDKDAVIWELSVSPEWADDFIRYARWREVIDAQSQGEVTMVPVYLYDPDTGKRYGEGVMLYWNARTRLATVQRELPKENSDEMETVIQNISIRNVTPMTAETGSIFADLEYHCFWQQQTLKNLEANWRTAIGPQVSRLLAALSMLEEGVQP